MEGVQDLAATFAGPGWVVLMALLPDGPPGVAPSFAGPPLIQGSFRETVRWLFGGSGKAPT